MKYVLKVYAQYDFIDGGSQSKTYGDQVEIAHINEFILMQLWYPEWRFRMLFFFFIILSNCESETYLYLSVDYFRVIILNTCWMTTKHCGKC